MSTPKRFFAKINYPAEDEAVLDGEEFIHAKTVLRVEAGDEIILLDNSGREYSAIISKIQKNSLTAHIIGQSEGNKEPKADIYLICGFLKNADKNEFIVQKAVELGVSRVAFFTSGYSSAYMSENKLQRLERVSKEAAKQCLRSRAPKVEYYKSLEEALLSAADYNTKLFACEFIPDGQADVKDVSGSCAVVVGSEGGFTKNEYLYANSMGFKGITLGKRILRAETAAVAVCALVSYFLGELK